MKVQVSIEFMIIFAGFLVAMILVTVGSWNNLANINDSSIDFEARKIIGLAADRINTAYLEGDGFSINLSLPETIINRNYTLYAEGTLLWLEVNGDSFHRTLLTDNITGNLSAGINRLSNVEGGLVIS